MERFFDQYTTEELNSLSAKLRNLVEVQDTPRDLRMFLMNVSDQISLYLNDKATSKLHSENWLEEFTNAFWTAVNATDYDESKNNTLTLLDIFAKQLTQGSKED